MSSQQQTQSQDRALQRKQSQTNAQIAAGSRVTAAGVGAQGHIAAAGVSNNRPSPTTYEQTLVAKQNSGQQLTPAEQAVFARMTQLSGHRRPPPGANTAGQFQNGQVYHDAQGNRARYVNGKFVPA